MHNHVQSFYVSTQEYNFVTLRICVYAGSGAAQFHMYMKYIPVVTPTLRDAIFLYLDIVGICEEHGEAVNPHAPARSGRQAILQRSAESLIDTHGLIIALLLGLRKARSTTDSVSSRYRNNTQIKMQK